jgi:hypothetical protein
MTPPFQDRQKVSAAKWDKTVPRWNRMGICIVVGRRRASCESGWLVNIMGEDGSKRRKTKKCKIRLMSRLDVEVWTRNKQHDTMNTTRTATITKVVNGIRCP